MSTTSDRQVQGARLRAARMHKGYKTATEAAGALGVNRETYVQHENGARSFQRAAADYAHAFDVLPGWLIFGETPPDWLKPGDLRQPRTFFQSTKPAATVPVVGYVKAGAEAVLYAEGQGPFDYVPAPEGAKESTVAAEIRGDSLGPFFNEWLVYWDDVRSPVTTDQLGQLCIVGLHDGRVLVKLLRASREPGLYHLLSQTEAPLLDQEIAWAAKVTNMSPR